MTSAETSSPTQAGIFALPDEILEAIVSHLPPSATVAFGSASRRSNKITFEPLVWRRHCVQTWKHWEDTFALEEKLLLPPIQTHWRQIFTERQRIDQEAMALFDDMLLTQQRRHERMEKIANHGYNVKDLMLRVRDTTPDDADDVLARRYHANAILGRIHRATALEKWQRLMNRQMVRLEEVLGAFDLFVLNGDKGDLNDLDKRLDQLASGIRERDEEFDDLSTRKKAVQIARYLRSEGLLGNETQEYAALRNNFISLGVFGIDGEHTSLPLQTSAIYCAVARRLGVNAKPINYPQHVYTIVQASHDLTLDGKHKTQVQGDDLEVMYMDPWRSSDEVPADQLVLRLMQMGIPPANHAYNLGAASTLDSAIRAGRNIMTSVQETREHQRGITTRHAYPDIEAAWYSMLWSMLVFGEQNSPTALHRRRQCLPYLVEHFQQHFPEDIGLIETHIPPMFREEREYMILLQLITNARAGDQNKKAPNKRNESTKCIKYQIGHAFRHARYGYEGFIVGWDIKCGAEQRWIEQMRVDDLPHGREQPFYNVVYDSPDPAPELPQHIHGPDFGCRVYYRCVCMSADHERRADDKSVRYVAEENIDILHEPPCKALIDLAGRYFKRWDVGKRMFESNIRDEYPDD